MNTKLLSIIVPAYKTADTISRCLASIFNQDAYSDDQIEVLVVNDASPDNMASVLSNCQKKYSSLRVVNHAENRREAGAHNTGVENTNGIYFLRLDSDDELRPGALSILLPVLRKYMPDILIHGFTRVDENGRELSVTRYSKECFVTVDTQDKKEQEIVFKEIAFGLMTGNAVYRRAAAPSIRQDSEFLISGDRHFGWEFFRQSRSFYVLNTSLENYYQYSTSVSKTINGEAIQGLLRLDYLFWQEFGSHPCFKNCAKYGFKRLFPALLGWHYEIVFNRKHGNILFSDYYFVVLRHYIDCPVGRDELSVRGYLLRFIARHKCVFLLRIFRFVEIEIRSRAIAWCNTLVSFCRKQYAGYVS